MFCLVGKYPSEKVITLTWSTDGAPIQKSNKVSAWPIFCIINELPKEVRNRRRNLLLFGIWVGQKKPEMQTYLEMFVSKFKDFQINIGNQQYRVLALACVFDLPAKAAVLNMKQYNGENGCTYCEAKGQIHGNGCARIYDNEDAALRTKDSIRANTETLTLGVKGACALTDLPHFDITKFVVIDYMHAILEGVVKDCIKMWFDPEEISCASSIKDRVSEVDQRLLQITPPTTFCRSPRPLEHYRNHYKASEMRNLILYYLPCLKGIVGQKYLEHAALLSFILHIALSDSISTANLDLLEQLIKRYQTEYRVLYPKRMWKINLHQMAHIVPQIRNWGPLWTCSMFTFEDGNGMIKRMVQGPTAAITSIGQHIMLNIAINNEKSANVLAKKKRSKQELDGCLITSTVTNQHCHRIRTAGTGLELVSKNYSHITKRNSSLVLVDDKIVSIESFAIINSQVFIEGTLCKTSPHNLFDKQTKVLSQLQKVDYTNNNILIRAHTTEAVLVQIKFGAEMYVCKIVNQLEKDR